MERIRAQLANTNALEPRKPSDKHTSALPQSDTSALPIKRNKKVIHSEDDDSDDDVVILDQAPTRTSQQSGATTTIASFKQAPVQFPIPRPYVPPQSTQAVSNKLYGIPNPYYPYHSEQIQPPLQTARPKVLATIENLEAIVSAPVGYETPKTSAEADKELKDLFFGAMEDGVKDAPPGEAIVEDFVDGIVLKPHQVRARIWMKDRESGNRAGGFLCDEMGLGKTIQTVTRIVDNRPSREDRKAGWANATLVICPVALMEQWAQEIKKYTGGKLTVMQHYGPSRTVDPDVLARVDVVITSYNTASSEHSAWAGVAKNEASSTTTKKKQDKSESANSGSDSEGSNFGKTLKAKKTQKAAPKKKKQQKALFSVRWWRILLDEAHTIKNHTTKGSLACCDLSAKYRWALTGTPIQNSVEDVYSLLKFLRVKPLHDWTRFNETIARPIKNGNTTRAMKCLHVVLQAVMLRRLKDAEENGEPLIKLPPKTLEIVECDFDEDEREFYTSIETKASETMKKFEEDNAVMKNYTTILFILLRLRQACNHPSLVSKDFKKDMDALESKAVPKSTQEEADEGDALADMFAKLGIVRRCEVCQILLDSSNAFPETKRCHDCNKTLTLQNQKMQNQTGHLPPTSAKIRKILELLEEISHRDGREKTIIFSQFISMLDLLEPFLKDVGFRYVRYDGSMNQKQRELSLQKIRDDDSVRIILISFKAGGSGLNLTACNNVILVDLWWNPALEEQAFGRVHRYGQERDVMIYKLTIYETVEQRILALQDKKRELARASLSGDKIKDMRLNVEDFMELINAA